MSDTKKISDDQVQEIIETLQGTCDTLGGAVGEVCGDDYDENDLSQDQLGVIDNEIFECVECSWWCEISEIADDEDENICQDCVDVR